MNQKHEATTCIRGFDAALVRGADGTPFVSLALNGNHVGVLPLDVAKSLGEALNATSAIGALDGDALRQLLSMVALIEPAPPGLRVV